MSAARRVGARSAQGFVAGRVALAMAIGIGLSPAIGCSRPPPDATPDGALRLFLDDMDAAGDDPRAMRQAYGLLGPAARANLAERTRRTIGAQGRQVQPWDMIAPGLFGVAFRPKVMRSTVVGDRASVEVLGEDPAREHASVVCVHEVGGWRVEPGLPDP